MDRIEFAIEAYCVVKHNNSPTMGIRDLISDSFKEGSKWQRRNPDYYPGLRECVCESIFNDEAEKIEIQINKHCMLHGKLLSRKHSGDKEREVAEEKSTQ